MRATRARRVRVFAPLNHRFVRSVSMLAGGTALGQALVLVTSPLLTRLYTPADFGVLAVYTSLMAMMTVLGALRYEYAIPLPEEDETAANVLGLCLTVVCSMGLLAGFVCWLWGADIARLVHAPGLAKYLWLLPVSFLGAGVYVTLSYWATRKKAYGRLAQTKGLQSLGLVAAQTAGGVLHAGTLGLLIGDAMGRMSGSSLLLRQSWREDRALLKGVSWRGIAEVARRYKRFPLLSSWSALLNSFGLQVPNLFLTVCYGPTVVGWYALALRVLGLPLNLISSAVSQVYLAEAAQLAVRAPEELRPLFRKTVKNMLLIGGPLVGVITLVAPWLFSLVFGKAWAAAGTYVQVLAVMFLLDFVSNAVGTSLEVLERQDLHMWREVSRLLLLSLAVCVAGVGKFSPLQALMALGAAGTLGYAVHLGVSWLAIRNSSRQGLRDG